MKEAKIWDPVEYLLTEEDMDAYLEAALEDGDPAIIASALGDIARARGIADLAAESGMSR